MLYDVVQDKKNPSFSAVHKKIFLFTVPLNRVVYSIVDFLLNFALFLLYTVLTEHVHSDSKRRRGNNNTGKKNTS